MKNGGGNSQYLYMITTEDSTLGYHVNVLTLVEGWSSVEIVAPMTTIVVATQSDFTHLDPLQIYYE